MANGLFFTRDFTTADLIIISTCGLTKITEDDSIKAIKYYVKRKRNESKFIITGCLPKINLERIHAECGTSDGIIVADLNEFDHIINARIRLQDIPDQNEVTNFSYHSFSLSTEHILKTLARENPVMRIFRYLNHEKAMIERFDMHKMYNIKISEGCLGNCAFCGMKFTEVSHKSRPLNEIINEFRIGISKGYRIFMLVATDSGSYGKDCHLTVVKLLEEIFKVEGDYQIIINDFNVRWFIEYYEGLKDIIIKNHKKIYRIILAIQSGSNRMLTLMKRQYTVEDVKRCVYDLKSSFPGLRQKISTQFMVGFPSETEEDFEMTVDLVRGLETPYANIYGYSDRPFTEASEMERKIEPRIIRRRISRLVKIRDTFRSVPKLVDKFTSLL